MEQLIVLGTGNAAVTRCYNTCFAIKMGEEYLLCDAGGGNGILRQLEAAQIEPTRIHHLILTHAHLDHMLGAMWLLRITFGTQMLKGRYQGDLHLYCHKSVADLLMTMANAMLTGKLCAVLQERIRFHNLEDGYAAEILGHKATFFDIQSTKLQQFGFTLTDETGRKLCCLGDEPYNPACEKWVLGSDWLLSEAFCLYDHRERFKPYEKHHSTVLDAARMATQLNVPHLVLWHTEEETLPERKQLYTAEARQAYQGDLYVPEDLEVIALG